MTHLKIGDKAPLFDAKNQNGEMVKLTDYTGQKIVLYFYPKDNTPGCTAEACNLRDNHDRLLGAGYKVFGVSPDSEKSHRNFIDKYELPVDLLADTDKKLCEAYGVWVEKQMYGKSYMGVARTSFLIDEKGVIENIIDKVDTKNHTAQLIG